MCCHPNLISLHESAIQLLRQFMDAKVVYVPREENHEAHKFQVEEHDYEWPDVAT